MSGIALASGDRADASGRGCGARSGSDGFGHATGAKHAGTCNRGIIACF